LDSVKKIIHENWEENKDEILRKRSLKHKQSFYKSLFENRLDKKVIPLFEFENYTGVAGEYPFQCTKCGHKFVSTLNNGAIPRCTRCYPHINMRGTSNIEQELQEFIENFGIPSKRNDRILIYPYELDIIIPSKKIAFELNGLYWHSELNGKGKEYHVEKTELCKKAGYRLIQIFEDEWIDQQEIVKSRIKHILGLSFKRVYARDCVVVELSNYEKNVFMKCNHSQGHAVTSVRLGLRYNDELVAAMTFAVPRFSKQYEWELVRYVTANGWSVVGGAGKLFSAFKKKYNPKSVVSYADRRWSEGNLYETIGFSFSHTSAPNYWYINNGYREHRIKYQKHKLPSILSKFDPNKTEWENMIIAGYDRIWDCGNLVYVWK
jgi:very-short-patch-repair endonuclease